MTDDTILMIPGPTNVPDEVRQAIAQPSFYHRSDTCARLLADCTRRLGKAFGTDGEVLTLASTGTGAMEAAIANLISPDDRVLAIRTGKFGDRLGKIANKYGALVTWMEVDPGQAAPPQDLADVLARKPFKAVTMTHNETSTGITQNVASLARVADDHRCLTIVDSVSGAGGLPVKMDEWGLDAVVSGSQKAWMLPPGLAFVALSDAAWEIAENCDSPRFYFDLVAARKKYQQQTQTPYTTSVNLLAGLNASLDIMFDEGLQAVYDRHAAAGKAMRAAMKALDLQLFADPDYASNTVTAVNAPENVDSTQLVSRMVEEHGIRISGGQGDLSGKIFRVGHMGAFDQQLLSDTAGAIASSLSALGYDCDPRAATETVAEVYNV